MVRLLKYHVSFIYSLRLLNDNIHSFYSLFWLRNKRPDHGYIHQVISREWQEILCITFCIQLGLRDASSLQQWTDHHRGPSKGYYREWNGLLCRPWWRRCVWERCSYRLYEGSIQGDAKDVSMCVGLGDIGNVEVLCCRWRNFWSIKTERNTRNQSKRYKKYIDFSQ